MKASIHQPNSFCAGLRLTINYSGFVLRLLGKEISNCGHLCLQIFCYILLGDFLLQIYHNISHSTTPKSAYLIGCPGQNCYYYTIWQPGLCCLSFSLLLLFPPSLTLLLDVLRSLRSSWNSSCSSECSDGRKTAVRCSFKLRCHFCRCCFCCCSAAGSCVVRQCTWCIISMCTSSSLSHWP